MAQRQKPENKKLTTAIQIRVSPEFKERLDKMAEETGEAISEMGRKCLQDKLRAFEQN